MLRNILATALLGAIAILGVAGCAAAPDGSEVRPVAAAAPAPVPPPGPQTAPQCGARVDVLRQLEARYGEVPVAGGITSRGALLEVTAAPGGGWSIILTGPGGATCLVSAGEGWRLLAPVPRGEGASLVLAHGDAEWIADRFPWCCGVSDCARASGRVTYGEDGYYHVEGLTGRKREGDSGFYRLPGLKEPWACQSGKVTQLRCLFMPDAEG